MKVGLLSGCVNKKKTFLLGVAFRGLMPGDLIKSTKWILWVVGMDLWIHDDSGI